MHSGCFSELQTLEDERIKFLRHVGNRLTTLWQTSLLTIQEYSTSPLEKTSKLANKRRLCMISGFRRSVRYSLFWDVTQRRFVVSHRRFGSIYLISPSRVKQSKNLTLEDGADRFSRNVGNWLQICAAFQKSEYLKKYLSNINNKDRNKSWGKNTDYVLLISDEACRYHHSTLQCYWSNRLRFKRDMHQSHTNINEACR